MTRKKITAEPILKTYSEVDNNIREFYGIEDDLAEITKKQQDEIDKIKAKFEKQAEPNIARQIRLEKDIQDFLEYHAGDFEKSRSKKLTFGKVGFQKSTQIKYIPKWTVKKVVEALKELGRTEFIKTSQTVKKAEIKAAELPADSMRKFGCFLNEKDEPYFEPDRDALANAHGKLKLVANG